MIQEVQGIQIKNNAKKDVNDTLAVEEMLSISINAEPYTITMRSPGSEQELVRGILLTEDVYSNKEKDPVVLVTNKNEMGYVTAINANIPDTQLEKGIETKRNLMSVTSCGMCGKKETNLSLGDALDNTQKLAGQHIPKMFQSMRAAQQTFEQSGGSHASAAFDSKGHMLSIQEDIGRHNAVDKVIGDLLLQKKLNDAICILVSGRLSYEIVSKAYKAGIPFLAAVSAPSSMAVNVAEEVGICLMAFCREDKFTVYSRKENIV